MSDENPPLLDWALELSRYHRWQNEVVFALAASLTDKDRRQDRGMFFRSIHATLDHILVVDRQILAFIDLGHPPPQPDLLLVSQPDFDALHQARAVQDADIEQRVIGGGTEWLQRPISFFSPRLNRQRSFPVRFLLAQLFNHGTHHRSQITAELHKLGIDYGPTDFPMNPYSIY